MRAASAVGLTAGSTLVGAGVVAAVAGGIAFPGGSAGGVPGSGSAPKTGAPRTDIAAGADLAALRGGSVSRDENRQPLPVQSLPDPAEPAVDPRVAGAATDRLAGMAQAQAQQVAAAEAAASAAAAQAEADRVAAEAAAAEQAAAAAAAEAERAAAEKAAAAAAVGVDPGSNRGIAASAITAYGWGDSQFQCLDVLWQHESNWDHRATNPSSGAFGIPQSLPASKMASFGDDWRTNPATQIAWGLNYIHDTYGTPCGAWSFWQGHNWY